MRDAIIYRIDTLIEAIDQTCNLAEGLLEEDLSIIDRKVFRARLYQIFDIEDEVQALKDEANRERILCDKQERAEASDERDFEG